MDGSKVILQSRKGIKGIKGIKKGGCEINPDGP